MMVDRKRRLQETLPVRARILSAVRRFFRQNGYTEIETPVRIPAPLPEPHIDAQPAGAGYLQTSPEICMKQLLAAGFEKPYQVCKCFRPSERGRRHLPEFTLLEWYAAGLRSRDLMPFCENLIEHIRRDLSLPPQIPYQGRSIDVSPPWERLSVSEAFLRFGSESMAAALDRNRFDEILGIEIEPHLGLCRPVILHDYPAAGSLLAAPNPEDPQTAERFEVYIGGIEIANACTELSDPLLQRKRFETERKRRREAGLPVYPLPEGFLAALERMPPAAGCAMGLDRLTMLLTDSASIDEVVAFPPETL
jgi:lysyl-tRNA synthetase class 2